MLVAIGITLGVTGCGLTFDPPSEGAIVGVPGDYNYSPSVMQTGNLQQFWWCGGSDNPYNPNQFSDTIFYESIDLSTHAQYGPMAVLGETPHGWDSAYTCNPKVIGGTFANPLGDGQTYTYAMYYVGTASALGADNSIGVAFSNDGIHWKKYPQPVILSNTQTGYGMAQPAVYNSDHQAGIWIFYEENSPVDDHVEAISTDGIHFTTQGMLTANGLDPNDPHPSWGDMAYDSQTGYWYAAFNLPARNPATTGGLGEPGAYGIELYRIPGASLLTGATPWQQLMTADTNLTGYEVNYIAGFLRDMYGDLNVGPYPTIQIYPSISTPQPKWNATPSAAASSGGFPHWEIGLTQWVPNNPLVPLNRYANSTTHEVTTGWIDPNGGFHLESTLGHLYQAPQLGATIPFYGCKNGSTDYFVSLDSACEGQRILGTNGYAYSQPVSGLNLVALYRCYTGSSHFVSTDPNCEGQATQQLLGYVLP
jgi:hypothetical protein